MIRDMVVYARISIVIDSISLTLYLPCNEKMGFHETSVEASVFHLHSLCLALAQERHLRVDLRRFGVKGEPLPSEVWLTAPLTLANGRISILAVRVTNCGNRCFHPVLKSTSEPISSCV